MEKCDQLMLRFTVLICAARTWKSGIISSKLTWLAVGVMMCSGRVGASAQALAHVN